jgi:hypothetical protein
MERQQISGNEEKLQPHSELKYKIQRQLLAYIIAFFEDHLEGFHAHEADMNEHENPYAYFLIGQIAEKFAVWFESLCTRDATGEKVQEPWTVREFMTSYEGQPQRVLQELVEPLGYTDPEEYLRELTEWFRVNPVQEESRVQSRDSMLRIPLGIHVIHKGIMAVMNKTQRKSA